MKIDINKLKKIVGKENVENNIKKQNTVVVYPSKIKEVQEIIRYANTNFIPVIPKGAVSEISNYLIPLNEGIVINLKRMNKILKIAPQDMYCKVEPGVTDKDLNKTLNSYGAFWPITLKSDKIITIGGEIGNNSSGVRSIKYGSIHDLIMGMKVVLANGDLVTLGSNTRVMSSGYQIDRVIVGSEGTLGIIVEATLKLTSKPLLKCLSMICFNDIEESKRSISTLTLEGFNPSVIELIDNKTIKRLNKELNLNLPDVESILFVEFDGNVKKVIDYNIEKMTEICRKHNALKIESSYEEKWDIEKIYNYLYSEGGTESSWKNTSVGSIELMRAFKKAFDPNNILNPRKLEEGPGNPGSIYTIQIINKINSKTKVDIEKLKNIVGEDNLRDNIADLYIYGCDASVHRALPSVVVRPQKVEQIQEILRYANSELIPVVARGAGSGMSGQTVPIDGGIVIDLKLMNRILQINPDEMLCMVEPGVVDDDLNKALKPYGIMWPAAPASSRIATIGGEISNNASGVRSVKYGATRDSILGMKVVLANGDLVSLGSHKRFSKIGYQLDRIIVGSEGTLAIIVEATLKLVTIPRLRCLAVVCFNTLEDAGNSISEIMSSGANPSMLELMDNVAIVAVNTTVKLGLPDVAAIIFLEADGNVKESVDYEIEKMTEICKKHNGFGIEISYDAKERERIFAGRQKLFASLSKYKENLASTSLADDMAVPNSKMAECASKIHEIAKRNNVIMSAYGHCGSGCMHTKILMDPTKKEQWESAKRAVEEMYDYVYSVGGTTSAEHGIALSKAPLWKKEKADSLELMRSIKKVFDPNNILNPHKLQDAPNDWVTATELRYLVTK